MRRAAVASSLVAWLVFACATGSDPLPPRAPDPQPPEQVRDHPGFAASRAGRDRNPPPPKKEPDPCARVCPSGLTCELRLGVAYCVAKDGG